MKMNQADQCLEEDVPAIVRLHHKVYGVPGQEPAGDLHSYYQTVLFNNPWCDDEIPSLVFRSEENGVEGLLGVLTYRMVFKGKPIRMAVPHSLMVSPDCTSPMVAIQMVRALFDGVQDLVVGDGANRQAKKLMEAMGAQTSQFYSMSWLCLLRPCSFSSLALRTTRGLKLLSMVARPLCFCIDALIRKVRSHPGEASGVLDCSLAELDGASLFSCVSEFTKRSPLHAEYKQEHIQWFWNYLQNNNRRGQSHGFEVLDRDKRRIGVFAYYLRADHSMEVILMWARENREHAVFGQLMEHAGECGAISVEGRMEPRFLQSISDYNCLVKHRRWVITQSGDAEILKVINSGEAMLSPLEGELWVHTLSDELH